MKLRKATYLLCAVLMVVGYNAFAPLPVDSKRVTRKGKHTTLEMMDKKSAVAAACIMASVLSMNDAVHATTTPVPTQTLAGIEIVPSGGGGFGGLGITPFGAGPFGGFGFGFGMRQTAEPGVNIRQQPQRPVMTPEQEMERAKMELEATRAKEQALGERIQKLSETKNE